MKPVGFAALLALCVAGQASGQATVTYTLEIGGGSATYRANWKDPPGCQPELFTPGSTADYQIACNPTWAVRMAVTGTHSNGFVSNGIASAAFDLELHDAIGNLVPNFGKGSVNTRGFHSLINDGTARTGCFNTIDPDEAAAFTVAYSSINPANNGRLVDDYLGGGPGMSAYQYPSTLNFPPGSIALSGTLTGFFVGYPQFSPSGCPGACGTGPGSQTAGVGYSSLNTANCSTALGTGPMIEGQLNLSGMATGTYSLVIIPRPGTMLLNGNFACQFENSGAFIEPDAMVGSTRSFIQPTDCGGFGLRAVVGRYIFYNHSFYDGNDGAGVVGGTPAQCATFLSIASCNDNTAVSTTCTALLPTQTPHTPAPVGELGGDMVANYSSYSLGINGIMIDVSYTGGASSALPVGTLTNAQRDAAFEFIESSTRSVTSAYTGVNRTSTATVSIGPHPTLASTDRIKIIFPDNTSTNHRWLRTRLIRAGILDNLISSPNAAPDGDRFYWGTAKGDSLSPSAGVVQVTSTDVNDVKAFPHSALNRAKLESRVDLDKNSQVNSNDQNVVKANPATGLTGLLLTGTAP